MTGAEPAENQAPRSWRVLTERLPDWARRLLEIGSRPGDDDAERLQKQSLVLTAVLVTILAVVWVVTYLVLGLSVSAAIPFAYQVTALLSLVVLARTGRLAVLRTTHLALWLVLPMLLQWSLGGFVGSSGVMLWSLAAPLGALVLSGRPLLWFGAYIALTVVSGLLEPILTPAPIPPWLRSTFFVLNASGVSTVVYFMLRYFTRGLATERQKSDLLLLNVLPAAIARRLKNGEQPLADRVDEAAVMFADLVDFTPISERLAPEEVVELLNEVFSEFDAMAGRRGLEKIKTVGDAYMVVGGLTGAGTDCAEAIAEMALEMVRAIRRHRTSSGEPLRMRIGIDIGPVVAGVIGQKKFAYDLWGDTVNTASRMESAGVPGEIQVTPRAYERLKERYEFVRRQPIDVKGKGIMSPLLLVGPAGSTDDVSADRRTAETALSDGPEALERPASA